MKQILNIVILHIAILFITGCSFKTHYTQESGYLYKDNVEYYNFKEMEWDGKISHQEKKDILFDGYTIDYIVAEDYFDDDVFVLASIDHAEGHWTDSFDPTGSYHSYIYSLFTLNEKPPIAENHGCCKDLIKAAKENIPYVKMLKKTYKLSKNNNINGFIPQKTCPKRTEEYNYYDDLLYQCYAKKLDEETFLIAKFLYPKRKEKDFQTEIMPTMLKSIKIRPAKFKD